MISYRPFWQTLRASKESTYTLIKDHRTGFESGNVTSVLDGSIDGFISAYLKWESLGRPQVKGGESE